MPGNGRESGLCRPAFRFGEDKCNIKAPWFGPKPQNFGTLVQGILKDAQERCGDKLDVHMSTPIVQLVRDGDKVVGAIGKDARGNYIRFNAKAVILATGAYENNATMVRRFCPDAEPFDKKVYHRTGDGNILAIAAGGVMEPVAHSTVMHDFDAGLMWDEPTFVDVNMNGERFVNEVVEMAYISKQLRWQPSFKGANMDAVNQETGSKGWYCQVYDNNCMEYAVGNLGGQFFGGCDYPFFSPGMSLGHAVTFGYIAGKHAAENL